MAEKRSSIDSDRNEKKDFHPESVGEKHARLRQQLVNKQNEAKAGRSESEIGLEDDYWKVKQDIQQKLHRLDEE